MRIILKSNMKLGGPFTSGALELGSEEIMLRGILDELSKSCGLEFVDPNRGEVNHEDYAVYVNGREYWLLPSRLDTKLHNEDEVKIDIVILGGG